MNDAVSLLIIAEALWFILPAGVANTVPVIAARYRWLPVLKQPLDEGRTWRGRRLLGRNKTWRGLFLGVLAGAATGMVQHLLADIPAVRAISLVPYTIPEIAVFLGVLLGFGALVGDAVKSFFKRQLGIRSGVPWRPFDQVDATLGAVALTWWYVPLSWWHIVTAVIVVALLTYAVSLFGVAFGIKKSL